MRLRVPAQLHSLLSRRFSSGPDHATARQKYWDLILIPKPTSNPVYKHVPDVDEVTSQSALVTSSETSQVTSTSPNQGTKTMFTSSLSIDPLSIDQSLVSKVKSLAELSLQESLLKAPSPPENCCMSGCAHCVWDIYQEDFSAYLKQKKTLRYLKQKFSSDTEALDEIEEEPVQMDPSMKAFLDMERAMKNK